MSWVLNILMPGAGLVWVGRTLAGVLLAVAYAPLMGVVLISMLIAPAVVPAAATALALAGAGGTLVLGQILLHRHRAQRRDAPWVNHVRALEEAARDNYQQGNYFKALLALEELLEIEPGDVEAHRLRARVYAADGKVVLACRAYRQLERADAAGHYRREVREALRRLGGEE